MLCHPSQTRTPYLRLPARLLRRIVGWALVAFVVWVAAGEPLLCLIHCHLTAYRHPADSLALATVQAATGRQIIFQQQPDDICVFDHQPQEQAPQPIAGVIHDAVTASVSVWVVLLSIAFTRLRPTQKPRSPFRRLLLPPPIGVR